MGRVRVRSTFECAECGQQLAQWAGRCPGCGAWGSISERRVSSGSGSASPSAAPVTVATLSITDREDRRVLTGMPGVDRVLGGGLVPASVTLLAGEPGIGKSTLLLQVAARLATAGLTCLYASGEESREQVAARARRLHIEADRIGFVSGRELPEVWDAARAERPFLLAVDSVQTLRDPESPSLPGGTSQVRACADALVGLAKSEGITVMLTGHVTN
jgi:DNA repair protein RadA/Sms